jgi:hypothetical protein
MVQPFFVIAALAMAPVAEVSEQYADSLLLNQAIQQARTPPLSACRRPGRCPTRCSHSE